MQAINKKSILMLAVAAALSFGAGAQSLEEGIKMVKYERYNSAEKILQPLAAGNPIANYYLGLTKLGQEKTAEAKAIFGKYPEDAANMAGLAQIAYMEKNPTEGKRIADAVASKAKKKDWQTLVFAADAINYGGGNPQDAVGYYEEALKRGGDNVNTRIGLGDAYQKIQGGGGKGMDNYENAVTKDAKNSLGYSRIGKLWYDARNYNDALSNYQKAKDADPANPLPYNDLANAYFYIGKYDMAKQNIEEYLKLSDQNCNDKIRYANILYLSKDYQNAINKMQEVITTCGDRPYMYRVLSVSQFETKDYDNALRNMQELFRRQTDPTKIIAKDYEYAAKIYTQQKKADSANYFIQRWETSDTASATRKATLTSIAEMYKSMNNDTAYGKSAEYYQKALNMSGDKATATDYFNTGLMYYYAKQFPKAATAFEAMEAKFPTQPSAPYWRARTAAAVDNEGKTGEGVPYFERWLAIPDDANYTHKPNDLNIAYQYMAIVAYNKKDKAKTMEYVGKIKAIEPGNKLAQQLEDLTKKAK
jgi:predicted Zn-dependent protease